jgi:3-dehydroquinate synthetase
MATAARIGLRRGLTAPDAADRLIGAIRRADLPIGVEKPLIPAILERLDMVGSIRGGSLRYVIPCDIGRLAILEDISLEEIASALPARPSL